MTTRSRDLWVRLAAATLLLTPLTACGGDTEPGAEPTPSSASPTEGDSASPSPTASASPTEPTVEPATGTRVTAETFSFNAPAQWQVVGDALPFIDLERDPGSKQVLRDPHGLISVNGLPSGRSFTLDQAARQSDAPGERLADVELDGVPVYHFSDSTSLESTETYGLVTDDFLSLSVTFRLFGSTKAEREALAASVLASWEWQS